MRLTSQGESRLQWMAGAFYEDVWDWWHYGAKSLASRTTPDWEAANTTQFPMEPPSVTAPRLRRVYTNFFEKTVRQQAVFGELTFGLTDDWSVTAGARWFEFDRQEVESSEVPRGCPYSIMTPMSAIFSRRRWSARARTTTS